ncbi:MAG TPA: 3-oxoacyl-[acyl-carrier-protein] synthase III C-terminal domain-containing protein [Chthoniobacter sp.]|jgi:3-oxoacyl-[acyl-carrier-protein] synthase-3
MKPIGIRGLGTALPEKFSPLADLPLISPVDRLASFGFEGAWISDDPTRLAVQAARSALVDAGIDAEEIDVLLTAGALPEAHHRSSTAPTGGVLDCFCYSASWLQEELGLDRAAVCGIAQQGCAGVFSALRTARALLAAEPELNHVLCVGADALPAGACREILYNVISDAACAVVVSRERTRHRWLGFQQISKGYYWDVPAKQSEIIAAYFPTGRLAIGELLCRLHLSAKDVDLVIPTGVNATSWPILLRLCGIPETRLYRPRRNFGHTIAADSFLLLEEAAASGCLCPGMRVLLFAYGFGSSWCALMLQVAEEEKS